jgi:tagatose 6-phosphate kinase
VWVVVTDSKRPVWVAGPSGVVRMHPLMVKTVNPIGCGDCLAAGLAARLAAGDGMLDAVRFGIAAAADNAGQLLPARVELSRLASLASRIVIEND